MNKYILLITFSSLSLCNIWDNIFGNYNAPYVYIPPDFHVDFGISRINSPYMLGVDYSTKLKAVKIQGQMYLMDKLTVVGTSIVNMSQGKLYLNTLRQSCQVFQVPQQQEKLNSKSNSFNQSLNIVEPNVVFQLISFYLGKNEEGMIIYDMSSLFEGENKVYAMFDPETKQLDSIEFIVRNQKLTLFVTSPLTEEDFLENTFYVPQEWDCDNPDNQVDFQGKNLEDLLVEVISNSVGPELFEELKNIDLVNITLSEESTGEN